MKPVFSHFHFVVLALVGLVGGAGVGVGCARGDKPYVDAFPDMAIQPSVKAQDESQAVGVRSELPKDTLARGQSFYPYAGQAETKARALKNPYRMMKDKDFRELGESITEFTARFATEALEREMVWWLLRCLWRLRLCWL